MPWMQARTLRSLHRTRIARIARIGAAAGIGLHAMLATLQGYP
ncbi:hypothetical protein XAC3810_130046 [Xanthomonas citri pv. citri]|uniref:Uncharacterized protein n=1 Tax=Xanthomonas citri pv. citri TaxID=611301 RepID=A0A0U5F876_XANCI|nr:hypothetical protein XAC3824_130045 [Xanthomonas citri pv. citri]CEE17509.1 hypothetical protein XAC9322_130043 [Xanthomonas citri pv. citri]CEE18552.1 hypothetical protein XAC1083_140045 [Xanthomonas citri pv. citri]CEE24750.1 hypothetical protein XAC902_150006 [Xanthomonas citri pv. citri]CEE25166.1 hypothetical protein XAC3810_130046 [Xanthomonas citri pv. citri]